MGVCGAINLAVNKLGRRESVIKGTGEYHPLYILNPREFGSTVFLTIYIANFPYRLGYTSKQQNMSKGNMRMWNKDTIKDKGGKALSLSGIKTDDNHTSSSLEINFLST